MFALAILFSLLIIAGAITLVNSIGRQQTHTGARSSKIAFAQTHWRQISITIFLAVILGHFIYQIQQPTSPRCGSEGFRASYVTDWDGLYGPCTYLQQVTDSLMWWLVMPLLYGALLFIGATLRSLYVGFHKKLPLRTFIVHVAGVIASCYVFIWLSFGLFMLSLYITG